MKTWVTIRGKKYCLRGFCCCSKPSALYIRSFYLGVLIKPSISWISFNRPKELEKGFQMGKVHNWVMIVKYKPEVVWVELGDSVGSVRRPMLSSTIPYQVDYRKITKKRSTHFSWNCQKLVVLINQLST